MESTEIHRRNRVRTITVQCDVKDGQTAESVRKMDTKRLKS